jgi:hypothetical protein
MIQTLLLLMLRLFFPGPEELKVVVESAHIMTKESYEAYVRLVV